MGRAGEPSRRTMRRIYLLMVIAALGFSCTIGVVMHDAASDGKPLVFKTRDISGWNLEFETSTSGTYAYTYNKYTSNGSCWMGVNEAGLAMTQSAAYNMGTSASGYNNASIMNYALANFTTVDEFEDLLIETDATGRATAANYAVIDAFGNGAIFEVGSWEHQRYDPDTSGILTRGNFSYIGSSDRRGLERMNRAKALMQHAKSVDSLTAEFVGMKVIADLERTGNDPYPLPFSGSFPGCPVGYVDTDSSNIETINNEQTHVAGVFKGVPPGGDPENCHAFGYFACPAVSVPFVLFPASHQPTSSTSSSTQWALYNACVDRYNDAFNLSDGTLFDTSYLFDGLGGGIWTFTRDINHWVYDTVRTQLDIWELAPPTPGEREAFQDDVLEQVYAAYIGGFMVGINENRPEQLSLEAHPNPFNSATEIVHTGNIRIVDAAGREVAFLPDGQNIWRPTDLPSGVYMAISEKGQSSLKIVYLK